MRRAKKEGNSKRRENERGKERKGSRRGETGGRWRQRQGGKYHFSLCLLSPFFIPLVAFQIVIPQHKTSRNRGKFTWTRKLWFFFVSLLAKYLNIFLSLVSQDLFNRTKPPFLQPFFLLPLKSEIGKPHNET